MPHREGTLGAAYAVPAGSTLLGVTVYATDGSKTASVGATLNNHYLVSGSTSQLAHGFTPARRERRPSNWCPRRP
jgi:hypothetical protein